MKVIRIWAATLVAFSVSAGTAPSSRTPTFQHDVAPILYEQCASCHRPGEAAPFSLLSYEDARKRAALIASVTASRYMPPWGPEPGVGEFRDSRQLSPAQIDTLRRWAAAGAPEGAGALKTALPVFSSEWSLGKPDLVVRMREPFTVPADGEDVYQCMVLPLGVSEQVAANGVSAIEVRPGNRRVVHHAILFLDANGRARNRDAATPEEGYRCFGGPGFLPSGSLGGWAPGATPIRLQEGVSRPLPANSDLVLQLHYHPSGKPESDQTEVGIYFSRVRPRESVFNLALAKRDLTIPPGEKHAKVRVDFTLPIAIEANAITPHMHWLGKSMRVTATLPDGAVKPLISVPNWDFNWQGQYAFKQTIPLPAGTRLTMEAEFDNSESNPRNPHHPPVAVHWGENTTDEMAIAFVQYQTPNPRDRFTLMMSLARQLDLWRFAGQR